MSYRVTTYVVPLQMNRCNWTVFHKTLQASNFMGINNKINCFLSSLTCQRKCFIAKYVCTGTFRITDYLLYGFISFHISKVNYLNGKPNYIFIIKLFLSLSIFSFPINSIPFPHLYEGVETVWRQETVRQVQLGDGGR